MRWIISANGKKYDHAASFIKNGYIDWKQNKLNYNVGDIVYIYCTRPLKRIMFKTCVEKVSMSFDQCIDDKEFWYDLKEYEKAKHGKYVRLRLINQADREELSLEKLKEYGLKAAPQMGIKINNELTEYIEKYLKDDYTDGYFPESIIPNNYYEGAVKTTKINKYERSSIARMKCIEYHGCKCSVCGLSFKDMYGEIGEDFIHVHHIVPLNEIGEEYQVNYKTDLIPICPNCHAMLHRKLNNKEISIEELQDIIKENNH